MDKIYYESILYRIIRGRLRLPFSDSVLYLYEPSNEVLEESFEVYNKAYEDAYFGGVPIKDELKEILFDNDMWSPEDDQKADETEKEIERLKIECYNNYYKPHVLKSLKLSIKLAERLFSKHKSRIHSLDHASCEGAASLARSIWIVSQTIRNADGGFVSQDSIPLTKVLEYYNSKTISSSEFRYIARKDPFRSMWNISKKNSNVFGCSSVELTKDQRSLCQFAVMYDNVYESSEAPDDEVIQDDDCLDGWFIVKRKEYEKDKNKKEIERLIGNSKIANSDEVFLMAKDKHTAEKIKNMNSDMGKQIIEQRSQQIAEKGSLKFSELQDVQQDLKMQTRTMAINKIKGK
jgi:hypothetical protein